MNTAEMTQDANERLRAMLEDLPLASLAGQGQYAHEMLAFWSERVRLIDGEAQRRLATNEADLLTGDTWAIERSWGKRGYDWDIDMLLDNFAPNMPADVWGKVYSEELPPPPPPPQKVRKVNTASLKALAKRLNVDLTPFYTEVKGAPKFSYRVVQRPALAGADDRGQCAGCGEPVRLDEPYAEERRGDEFPYHARCAPVAEEVA